MITIKIILNGCHIKKFGAKDSKLIATYEKASSNIVLIRGEKNIIFDTGNSYIKDDLLKALDNENLKPEEVDYIIQSHWHLDHCANNHLFKNAKIITGNGSVWSPDGSLIKYKNVEEIEVPEVKIIKCEGHLEHHIAAVVEIDGKNHIIAGDAVREDYIIKKIFKNKQFIESAKKLLRIADILYPGHGEVMEKDKIKELLKRLESENN